MNHRERAREYILTSLFLVGVIALAKIKFHPIFGTPHKFSALTMYAPVIPAFTGTLFGAIVIFGARVIQLAFGLSQANDIVSYIIYLPVFLAGYYFSKMFKNKRYHVLLPIMLMALFLVHPIGRQVWYYSLFWLIPIIIAVSQTRIRKLLRTHDIPTIYLYALAATFIDHAVGSVMFLYYINIPAKYWIMSIPFVPIERLIYALGITLFYLTIRTVLKLARENLNLQLLREESVLMTREEN